MSRQDKRRANYVSRPKMGQVVYLKLRSAFGRVVEAEVRLQRGWQLCSPFGEVRLRREGERWSRGKWDIGRVLKRVR